MRRTLIAWLKKMTERKLAVFDDDCRAWLEREMRANPADAKNERLLVRSGCKGIWGL